MYIHSAVAISAQDTFEKKSEQQTISISEEKAPAIHPNYREYISAAAARRMAPAVKMGVAAAKKALFAAGIAQPDAILVGSGMGCMQDTEKFLNALLANNETFVTPTAFIQSTHNTVGAQIALELQCHSYNNTYVHGSVSFEHALLDAQLYLTEHTQSEVLVGGVDELGTEFVNYVQLIERNNPDGIRVPLGEGAGFFTLSNEKKDSCCAITGVKTLRKIVNTEVGGEINTFLKDNALKASEIDAVFVGTTGDRYDVFCEQIEDLFADTEIIK